jgi:catechol 2,3-dioxygenase-like lactoylglutathione lyase family enzyme
VHAQEDPHAEAPDGASEAPRNRPDNQVAVLTVWAPPETIAETAAFYERVLGLRLVGSGEGQYILDTDGTFVIIMEGRLQQPQDTRRRWPMFALTVPDLDVSLEALRAAAVEFPWGVEEFGSPNPSSRYVMFHDPAGNLIEIVEWL